jgi:hypothetical protein
MANEDAPQHTPAGTPNQPPRKPPRTSKHPAADLSGANPTLAARPKARTAAVDEPAKVARSPPRAGLERRSVHYAGLDAIAQIVTA